MDGDIGRDRYEVVDGLLQAAEGLDLRRGRRRRASTPDDNVYVFYRGNHPVMIFDRDGHFLDAWGEIGGEHYFTFPHGLSVGLDGFVYTADSRDHTDPEVDEGRQARPDARQPPPERPGVQRQAVQPADARHGRQRTVTSTSATATATPGSIASAPDGELQVLVGLAGHGPGEFNTVHSVFIDHADGDKCTSRTATTTASSSSRWAASTSVSGRACACRRASARARTGTFYVAELSIGSRCSNRDGHGPGRAGATASTVDDCETGGCAARAPGGAVPRPDGPRPGQARARSRDVLRAARHRGRFAGQLLRGGGVGVVDRPRPRESQHPEVRPRIDRSRSRWAGFLAKGGTMYSDTSRDRTRAHPSHDRHHRGRRPRRAAHRPGA